MKIKKRFWTTVALTVSSVFLLAGCGGNNETANEKSSTKSGDGPVELEFWSFWGSGPRNEAVEKIISDFNEKQDDIVVKHVFQPWGDIWTKSLASVAAGNPPDVIIQDINSVRQRADANQAIDLQEYIDKEDEDIKGRFYPQLLSAATFEDDVYGLPFNTDTQVLFYNKDLFEKAGLDPETPPATWADLEKYSAALEEKDGDKWKTIGFYPLWSTGPDVWALNADNGVSWFDDKDNVKINTPDKVDSLQWILDWQKHIGKSTVDSYEAEFGAGIADPFVSELVAMRGQNINYLVELNELEHDINFGVALLPEKTEGSGHYSWGGGFTAEIPYGAKNQDASWEFIKYLTSDEVQEYWGSKGFDIMANQEANESLATNPDLDDNGRLIYEMASKALETTVITPTPLSAPDYLPLVNTEIDAVMLGKKSPEDALKDAQNSVEKLVEQNK